MRLLDAADVPQCFELSSAAGWNQTEGDWRRLIELEPDGCFGIEMNGRIVATSTLACYGELVAWVGMVLTHPEYRRRGFARQLVAQTLERARTLHVKTVKLDATDDGFPLYASLGFRPEQPVERWLRAGAPPIKPDERREILDIDLGQDLQACGYDRSRLLSQLRRVGQWIRSEDGYCFVRPGRLHSYLGPFVARTPRGAQQLLSSAFSNTLAASWFWDILPQSTEAAHLARQFGFAPVRRLTRMVYGDDHRGNEDWIYGIAGFEFG